MYGNTVGPPVFEHQLPKHTIFFSDYIDTNSYLIDTSTVIYILNFYFQVGEKCNNGDNENVPPHSEEFMALDKGIRWSGSLEAEIECD